MRLSEPVVCQRRIWPRILDLAGIARRDVVARSPRVDLEQVTVGRREGGLHLGKYLLRPRLVPLLVGIVHLKQRPCFSSQFRN